MRNNEAGFTTFAHQANTLFQSGIIKILTILVFKGLSPIVGRKDL